MTENQNGKTPCFITNPKSQTSENRVWVVFCFFSSFFLLVKKKKKIQKSSTEMNIFSDNVTSKSHLNHYKYSAEKNSATFTSTPSFPSCTGHLHYGVPSTSVTMEDIYVMMFPGMMRSLKSWAMKCIVLTTVSLHCSCSQGTRHRASPPAVNQESAIYLSPRTSSSLGERFVVFIPPPLATRLPRRGFRWGGERKPGYPLNTVIFHQR